MLGLPTGAFDPSTGQWKHVQPATQPVEREALSLATMNIWFGEYFAVERYRAIADLLVTHRPDFIALQEVTPKALRIFLNQDWIQRDYFSTDIDGSTPGDYGVMIFSRLPIKSIHLIPLLSAMGRQLLVVEVLVNDMPLHIATVHLESTKSMAMIRGQQLA